MTKSILPGFEYYGAFDAEKLMETHNNLQAAINIYEKSANKKSSRN